MKYSDVKDLLPNATHIYVDVTEKEMNSIKTAHYVTDFEGKKVLGTELPIPALADKELIAGSVSF